MIFTLHGVVDNYDSDQQSVRSYVSKRSFERHLKGLASPYGNWNSHAAITNILTVDDATYAGVEACLMAREYGHHVIFFVNPWQIESTSPYYLHLLNAYLDARTVSDLEYEGLHFDLDNTLSLKNFRNLVKRRLITLSETNALEAVHSMSQILKCGKQEVPFHSRTISMGTLMDLQERQVQIESHGWSHRDITALSSEELIEDVIRSAAWLEECLGTSSNLYAVPFGRPDVPIGVRNVIKKEYFLSDPCYDVGQISHSGWNRIELTNQLREISH